MDVIKT